METHLPPPATKTQANTQAAGLVTVHFVVGIVLSLICSGLFAAVWDAVKDKDRATTQFDRSILTWMHAHQNPHLTAIAEVLAHMGSPPFIVGVAVVGALTGLAWRKVRGAAWTFPIAVVGAGLIIQGIKIVFRRPRPALFSPLLHEGGYSFPSGHSLIAIVVYGLLGYFLMHLFCSRGARRTIALGTGLLVFAIGVSRPYVQVHYPTDVLAGWLIGTPWLMTCLFLHEVLTRRFAAAGEPVLPQKPVV